MIAVIIILSILVYASIATFVGSFWFKYLYTTTGLADDSSFVFGGALGFLWPVSIFLLIMAKTGIKWFAWLSHMGIKTATKSIKA